MESIILRVKVFLFIAIAILILTKPDHSSSAIAKKSTEEDKPLLFRIETRGQRILLDDCRAINSCINQMNKCAGSQNPGCDTNHNGCTSALKLQIFDKNSQKVFLFITTKVLEMG